MVPSRGIRVPVTSPESSDSSVAPRRRVEVTGYAAIAMNSVGHETE